VLPHVSKYCDAVRRLDKGGLESAPPCLDSSRRVSPKIIRDMHTPGFAPLHRRARTGHRRLKSLRLVGSRFAKQSFVRGRRTVARVYVVFIMQPGDIVITAKHEGLHDAQNEKGNEKH
jgi:hypothetical protein